MAGPTGAELLVAAIGALAFVLAALAGPRARARAVGDAARRWWRACRRRRWPTAARSCPELAAGALLAGAALCALSLRHETHAWAALGGAALLAALPWLGPQFVVPGLPVAWVLVRWALRARRRFVGLVAAEVMAASLIFYVVDRRRALRRA